jgi:hypothetical protein
MRAIAAFAAIGVLLLGPPAHAEGQQTTRYFSWAALKVNPAKPTDEITPDAARAREASGQAYYIATYDDAGRIILLEKRLRGATFFRYTYAYPNGEPVRTDAAHPSLQ